MAILPIEMITPELTFTDRGPIRMDPRLVREIVAVGVRAEHTFGVPAQSSPATGDGRHNGGDHESASLVIGFRSEGKAFH